MARIRIGTARSRLLVAWGLTFCLAAAILFFPPMVQDVQSQAGRPADSEDLLILRQAQGAFNNDNLSVAKQYAKKIMDAPGSVGEEARNLIKTIDDITIINKNRQSAVIAIQRRKFEDACEFLHEIQAALDGNKALKDRYADFNNLKSQAGGCPQAQAPESAIPDPAKSDYDKAMALREQDQLDKALKLFKLIARSYPDYRDVKQQTYEIQQEIDRNRKKSQDERFADRLSRAEQSWDQGDFRAMRKDLDAADSLRPGDPNVAGLRQKMETAILNEENELADALSSFYSGEYEQVHKRLEVFLKRHHASHIVALAHFYQGAALGSRFFLGGETEEAVRNEAGQLFLKSLKDDPTYFPQLDAVSPRIMKLYLEATGNQN